MKFLKIRRISYLEKFKREARQWSSPTPTLQPVTTFNVPYFIYFIIVFIPSKTNVFINDCQIPL